MRPHLVVVMLLSSYTAAQGPVEFCIDDKNCTRWPVYHCPHVGGSSQGKCVPNPNPYCHAGKYFNLSVQDCEPCPPGTYKEDSSDQACSPCPADRQLTPPQRGATSTQECYQAMPGFRPQYGPIAGGTLIRVNMGEDKNGQQVYNVTVAGDECKKLPTGPEWLVQNGLIECKTPRAKAARDGVLTVNMAVGANVMSRTLYEYRPNPIITHIPKLKTIIGGGIVLTVSGVHLDSVAVPRMVVTRVLQGYNTTEFKEDCDVYEGGESMGCPTPDLTKDLPAGVITRRSRRAVPSPRSFNEDWGLQFHLGFELDGEESFKNVSKTMVGVGQLMVYPDPVIHKFDTHNYVMDFNPEEHPILNIFGSHLNDAAEVHDFSVLVGVDGVCNITHLLTNALTCRPPTQRPDHEEHWPGPNQEPRVRVYIGTREFFVGFLRYSSGTSVDMVVVIVAAVIGLVFILLLTTVLCYCYRRRLDSRDKNLQLAHTFPSPHSNVYSETMPPAGGYMRPRSSLTGSVSTYSGSSRVPFLTLRGSSSTGSPPPTPGAGSTYSKDGSPSWQHNVAYHLPRPSLSSDDIMKHISPDLALTVTECRLDADRLVLGQVIGQGHFGTVHVGELWDSNRETKVTVAVKTVQGRSGVVQDVISFLQEAVVMKDFNHSNVLSLLGVVIQENKPYVILPYMEHGDLKSYISEPSRKITVRELVAFSVQVADGMKYLTSQKYVHRDLATRNCMINKSLIVKIADFGLSRDIYKSDYYRLEDKHRPLPVKWMAIESLQHGVFSTKSDVWSFGVLMWELLTRGCSPYPDIDAFSVKKYLVSGRRLSQPEHAPDEVYAVMSNCWHELPEKRPSFTELHRILLAIVNNEAISHPNYLRLI